MAIEYEKILSSNEITVIRLLSPFVPFVIPEGRSPLGVIIVARATSRRNNVQEKKRDRKRSKNANGRGVERYKRSSTSVVYSCSIMPRPLQASFLRPDIRAPAFLASPTHRGRTRFFTFRATFITHQLPPIDSS